MRTRWLIALGTATLLLSGGCRVLEWVGGVTHARLGDGRIEPYIQAAARSRRAELGFSPLPRQGDVGVEIPRFKRHYDVMLHFGGRRVSRTVAFLVRGGNPVWSGEQEIHYSGRTFETVDGQVEEHFVLSYSTVKGDGTPLGGYVAYWGPDEKLMQRTTTNRISVAEAKRIWETWPQ
jgi:hypothetical protein